MFLLGVYKGDGVACDETNSICLLGTQYDFPFYEDVVSPLIYRLFNLKCNVVRSFTKEFNLHAPKMNVSSQAHHTWLKSVGFPMNGEDNGIDFRREGYDEETMRKAFFAGIVASMGNLEVGKKSLKMPDTDEKFLKYVKQLAKGIGYHPSRRKSYRGLVFTIKETRGMVSDSPGFRISYNGSGAVQKGIYVNPRHLQQIAESGIAH
jgi:hypothetical protein